MTLVCATYFFVSGQLLGLQPWLGYSLGFAVFAVVWVMFKVWYNRFKENESTN